MKKESHSRFLVAVEFRFAGTDEILRIPSWAIQRLTSCSEWESTGFLKGTLS